jgi:Zn-dependent metalloprotease
MNMHVLKTRHIFCVLYGLLIFTVIPLSNPGDSIFAQDFKSETTLRHEDPQRRMNEARTRGDSKPSIYALPLARSGPAARYGLAIPRANQKPELILEMYKWMKKHADASRDPAGQKPAPEESVTALSIPPQMKSKFGGLLYRDPRTRLPSRITGMHAVPETILRDRLPFSEPNVERILKNFLLANEDLFGVLPDDLKLIFTRRYDGVWYVRFQQLYRNIPVHQVSVGFVADSTGAVTSYSSNFDPYIDAPTEPEITLEVALDIAKSTYDTADVRVFEAHDAGIIIFLEPRGDDVVYHLAWKFLVSGEQPNTFLDKNFIIDAVSGEVLVQYNDFVNKDVKGRVRGEVYPENPTTPPVATRPLAHAYVDIQNGARVTTGGNGYYKGTTSSSGSFSVTSRLEGPYAKVEDNVTGSYSTSNSGSGLTGRDFTWTATDRDHINVFYHMNWFHDWFETWLNHRWKKNKQMPARVNVTDKGKVWNNASANGSLLKFGADNFARCSDVIYHEYTHNIIHDIFNGWIGLSGGDHTEGYGMDEGFADYFACAATNDADQGEGLGGGRDLDNAMLYPGPVGYHIEGHTAGQIIAGAAWDLRESFTSEQAIDNLVLHTLFRLATQSSPYYFSRPLKSNFLSAMRQAALTLPKYPAPKVWEIDQAFRNHDLLPVDLFIRDYKADNGNVPSNSSGKDITDSPDIRVDGPPFSSGADEKPLPGKVNRVYVRIRNKGYNAAGYVSLSLYEYKSGGWSLIQKKNVSGNIAANSNTEVSVDWTPPYQREAKLLAKVASLDDPITEDWNIALENNIAQKKMTMRDNKPPVINSICDAGVICIVNNECRVLSWGHHAGVFYHTNAGVSADVSDAVSGVDVIECVYRFCETGGKCTAWKTMKPTSQVGDCYHWDLGGFSAVGEVEYKIRAFDYSKNKVESPVYKITVTDDCDQCSDYYDNIRIYSMLPVWTNTLLDPPWTEFEHLFELRINFLIIPVFDYTDQVIAAFEKNDPPSAVVVDIGRLQNWGDTGLLNHFMPLDEMTNSDPELLSGYSTEQVESFTYTREDKPVE